MKKYTIISISLFLVGAVSFVVASYTLQSYREFLALFSYYGIDIVELNNKQAAETIFNFRIGIVKYTLLGIVAWTTSVFFLIKRLKKV